MRQDIANECCSSRRFGCFLRLGFDFRGADLAFRLFVRLDDVGCAISAGRVRYVLRGFSFL